MGSLYALAAPLALMLPIAGQGSLLPLHSGPALADNSSAANETPIAPLCSTDSDEASASPVSSGVNPLNALNRRQTANQVRIEQRVIIRISPQRSTNRNSLFANLPRQPLNSRYEERKVDDCIPVSRIAGVQTGSGNQLLLFLRDRRIIRINLEKSCRARDFYSGFYVERNKDGKLCVARDKLQSRTGANCEVARMRQLVAVSK